MALIAIAVYCTAENKKDECLQLTLSSLAKTVDHKRHGIVLSVNSYTEETKNIIGGYWFMISDVIFNDENIGTARAINKVWQRRQPGEHAIKMDDDIVINRSGWVDEMEAAIARDARIGQVGLKRKDCWEYPEHPSEDLKSTLRMLPHVAGEPWIVVEEVKHVMGSCVMHSSALLGKVGGLFQPALYGYDDVIMSHRTHLAGFYSCFLPHINIDHIDQGQTPFQHWKEKHAGEHTQEVIQLVRDMYNGVKPIYYGSE